MSSETSKTSYEKWLQEVKIVEDTKQRILPLPSDSVKSQQLIRYILHSGDSKVKRYCSYALLYSYPLVSNLNILFYILDIFSKDPFIVLLVTDKLCTIVTTEYEYLELFSISKTMKTTMAKDICKLRMLHSLKI